MTCTPMELRMTWAFVHIHLPSSSIHEVLLVSNIGDCLVVLFTHYTTFTPETKTSKYTPKLQQSKVKQRLHRYFSMSIKSWLKVLERLDKKIGEIKINIGLKQPKITTQTTGEPGREHITIVLSYGGISANTNTLYHSIQPNKCWHHHNFARIYLISCLCR